MSALDELQFFVADAVRQRRDLRSNPELVRRAAELFAGNDRLSPIDQLEIYREQYWLRHTTALLEDYPGVSGIVGQRAWERLVEDYLVAQPPSSFSLRDLGRALPDFIRDEATWLEHHPLCLDMARLEWATIELFDAASSPRLDPARLVALGDQWEHVRLVLSPALRLLRVEYPVVDLRKRLRTPSDEPVLIPERRPACLLLYRAELQIMHETLDPLAFALLEALESGASLGAACERASALSEAAGVRLSAEVGAWFAHWTAQGLVIDVVPSSTT